MSRRHLPAWMRRLHRWGTLLVALPFLVILVTGILLQWKKEVAWIQPPTQQGTSTEAPALSFADILAAARSIPEADIRSWEDVDRLDVRPGKGVVKVRSADGWEVQVDAHTGRVLYAARRWSDLFEALHDGSWFHDGAKLWVFFPVALVTLVLYGTGLYLFYLPYGVRWRRRRDAAVRARRASPAPPPPAGPPAGDGGPVLRRTADVEEDVS